MRIALGSVLCLAANCWVTLDPETFFLLPLPLLLFSATDASLEEPFRDGETVLELALGLVLFTAVDAGRLFTG